MLPNSFFRRRRNSLLRKRPSCNLHVECLEARDQPAVAAPGLEVATYFTYTTAAAVSGPNDLAFAQGGLFGDDLYFTDNGPRQVYRLNDINNDHDASDAGEGTILYQFPTSPDQRPQNLIFGNGVGTWGNELYLVDDGPNQIYRVSDNTGSFVLSTFASFSFGIPTPTGAAYTPDGQFMLVSDCQNFTQFGGGSDGRIYRVSQAGVLTLWATGANLPNGLWDNNSSVAMTSDGWYTVGHNSIVTPGGTGQIVQFRDNNADGDALDTGEGRVLIGSNVAGLNKKQFAYDANGVLYVAAGTTVVRLEDLNHDGDYHDGAGVSDPGESTTVLTAVGLGVSTLRVGPDGAVYVGARETANRGVVYRMTGSQPPAPPSTPDLDTDSDLGTSNADNITADNTPTFTGTAQPGSSVSLFSNSAGPIGAATAGAAGNWTITATLLADGTHQITAIATDAAGNASDPSAALPVSIDSVAPTIGASLDRSAAPTGWYNIATGAPTATFSGDDGSGSGVASVSGPYHFGDGAHLSATGTVTDVAGNVTTDSFFDIFVDLTAPTIGAGLDRSAAPTGWYNIATGAPTATFSGNDGSGSGVASVSGPYLFGEGANLSATGTVTDVAGNATTQSFFDIFVDLTTPAPPTIMSPADGTVTSQINLTIAGVGEPGAPIEVFANALSLGSTTANAAGQWSFATPPLAFGSHTFSAAATDIAGNTSNRSPDVHIVVENTGSPTVVALNAGPSQVNLNGSGVVPITLYGTAGFDVATLDLATLRLAGAAADHQSYRDVDGDGRLDLVLHFRRIDFVDEYAAALAADLADGTLESNHQDVALLLTGNTLIGNAIIGTVHLDLFMSGKKLNQLLATI